MTRHLSWLLLLVSSIQFAFADDSDPDAERESERRASVARLTLMRRRVRSLSAVVDTTTGSTKVDVIEAPLLRYSNPAANIVTLDATIWAWGRVGRPAALASVEAEGCELVSLTEQGLSLSSRSGLKWTPHDSEATFKILPDGPIPGDSEVVRARQMKEQARRFSAKGHYGDDSKNLELRLMDRYIHRYADTENGIVDGAIFAFAAGTNPEVLLFVECRKSDQIRRDWFYACARLSAGGLDVRLDENVIWTRPPITRWDSVAPYISAAFTSDDLGPDEESKPSDK